MAIRLEKSGELILIKGAPDPSVHKKRSGGFGPWLVLVVFVAAAVGAAHIASAWPVVAHTVKGFLAAAN